MRLRKPWSVTTLAVVGLFALAGCGQSETEAEPNIEAIEESTSPSAASMQPESNSSEIETESFGSETSDSSSDDSLLSTCQDYAAFDREFVAEIEGIMTLAANPDASEQEMAEANEQMQGLRSEFEGIIAEAENQDFVQNAEKTLESIKIFEQMTEPGLSMSEKDQLSSDPAMQTGVEAEEQLVQMCNTELGY